jgi:MFS family permease
LTEPSSAQSSPTPKAFAALYHPGFRPYVISSAMVMMADSIEHVISYWMLFQKFHSPALAGFAVISHWLPFLFFSVYSGALADRFDPRRIIQIGMAMFMLASLTWGVLFVTDTLQTWHAVIILTLHGFAGVAWAPSAQLILHRISGGGPSLQSAVRLFAMSRTLGLLMGPAVGGAIMIAIGPKLGIFLNVLFYLPLTFWLRNGAPASQAAAKAPARPGLGDIIATLRDLAGDRIVLPLTLVAGAASLLVGNAHQAQMPQFAQDLGHGEAGFYYSALLAANATGALIAGIILESRGGFLLRPQSVFVGVMLWCCCMAGFAASTAYPLSLLLLFCAGFLDMSYNSSAQTLVQINAPPAIRGRVIGLYNMFSMGGKAFAGFTVGVGGSLIGIHWSLALSAAALFTVAGSLYAFGPRLAPAAEAGD